METLTDSEPAKLPLCKPNYWAAFLCPALFWLFAPWILSAVFALCMGATSWESIFWNAEGLIVAIWTSIGVLIFTFLLGLPLHLIFRATKRRDWVSYCLTGTIVGAFILPLIFISQWQEAGIFDFPLPLQFALASAVIGGSTAYIFWRSARPDLRK